jgi:hypothetical protein
MSDFSEEKSSLNLVDDNITTTAIEPLEQRKIQFYDDEVLAVLIPSENGPQVYVPLRPISDYLGLAWSGQYERLKRDPVLSTEITNVRVTRTKYERGNPNLISLPLDYLPGWLFGINADRVRPELRDKIIRYQRECFRVLWKAFQNEAQSIVDLAGSNSTPTVKTDTTELERIRDMGLAIARMSQEQIDLANKVDSHEERLNKAARVVGNLDRRVTSIENKLSETPLLISEAQASQVSERVKALAEYIMKLDPAKKAPYGAIFSELYRRFGVSDYHHIQSSQFEQVMNFLNDWRENAGAERLADQLAMFDDNNSN